MNPIDNLRDHLSDLLGEDNVTPLQIADTIRKELRETIDYHEKMAKKAQDTLNMLSSTNNDVIFGGTPRAEDLYPRSNVDDVVAFTDPSYWGNHIPGAAAYDTISFGTQPDTISFASSAGTDKINIGLD